MKRTMLFILCAIAGVLLKNTFAIPLEHYQSKIYIQSSGEIYHGLLRNDDGVWEHQNFSAATTPGK